MSSKPSVTITVRTGLTTRVSSPRWERSSRRARSPSRTGRWGHDFVEAQFVGQFINRRKRYPAGLRQTLTIVRGIRHKADYQELHVTEREASRVLRLAREFVESVNGGAL